MDLENFPVSDRAKKMLQTVTKGFYDDSYVGKWLFQVMGMELDDAAEKLEELRLQIFPETATWGLAYHEQKYGIIGYGSLDERRKTILKKITVTLPFNPTNLQRNVAELIGIQKERIIIEENTAPYTFTIKIEEDEDVIHTKDGIDYVRKIKPSHLHLDVWKWYISNYIIDIKTNSNLYMRSDFYPRYNLPKMSLDGSWQLDGAYKINGYKTGSQIDFYPVKMSFYSDINNQAKIFLRDIFNAEIPVERQKYISGLTFLSQAFGKPSLCAELKIWDYIKIQTGNASNYRIFSCIQNNARYQNKLELRSDAKEAIKQDNQVTIKSGAKLSIGCSSHLTIEKDLWRLDGRRKLDGSMRLDAAVYEHEL